jgi:hypothetical protein
MILREQKRILFFLHALENYLEADASTIDTDELLALYTDSELRKIIHWLYNEQWSVNSLGFMNRSELVALINSNYGVLLWTIDQLEKKTVALLENTLEEVATFFQDTYNEIHYLASKPVENWNSYDQTNYRSLRLKAGATKKVFVVLPIPKKKRDKATPALLPNYLFDTEEEAAKAIEHMHQENANSTLDFRIASVWLKL